MTGEDNNIQEPKGDEGAAGAVSAGLEGAPGATPDPSSPGGSTRKTRSTSRKSREGKGGEGKIGALESATVPSSEAVAGGESGAVPDVPTDGGPQIAPVEARPLEPRWYILRVQAGREDLVRRNLEKMSKSEGLSHKIRRVLVPSERVSEMKGRKKRVVERKLYPGYVMVEMIADVAAIYHVRGTQGVGDFIGGGAANIPDPLPDHEVERILGVAERGADEPKLNIQFKKGQNVKIKNGPFENFTGVVEEVSPPKGTIRVIVTYFGRATPIELEYWEVEAI